jgi:Na+/H+ antiporter NhaD/arsenite permease-like protein
MMNGLLILIFLIGYVAIAFEHSTKVDKAAPALITGVLCWLVYMLAGNTELVNETLLSSLGEIASILFFLLGAMTIVELIDGHDGFDIVTQRIKTKNKRKLLFIVSILTFFLSSLLDNLTTTIVMVSLCNKLLQNKEDKLWFSGMIIIAANAGGVWSPLGDVTTTMLWIGGQITALNIIKALLLPSFAVCVIPTIIIAQRFRNKYLNTIPAFESSAKEKRDGKIVLVSGVGAFLFVPIFKTVTHLPPFMGMMMALGFMWIITTLIHKRKEEDAGYSLTTALSNIDSPSILFFLGILLAVSALQSAGVLTIAAHTLNHSFGNIYAIGTSLGLLSALIDNVPLVAATQGMYSLSDFPADHSFWNFIALTTGTGGSAIIIGSAAGVAAMGLEKIKFGWYLKKISWIALAGFVAGIAVFLLQHSL